METSICVDRLEGHWLAQDDLPAACGEVPEFSGKETPHASPTPLSSDDATLGSSSALEHEPVLKRRNSKPKHRTGNAENQARYRARCKAKRSDLEEAYLNTKDALEGERREYAHLSLDTAVLSGILSVRDESIGVLEALDARTPESPVQHPPGLLNIPVGKGVTPSLHQELLNYHGYIEGLFQDLAAAEGGSRQDVKSVSVSYDTLLRMVDDVKAMDYDSFALEMESLGAIARRAVAEMDAVHSRLPLLQVLPVWKSLSCLHMVALSTRPELVHARMGCCAYDHMAPEVDVDMLEARLRLSPGQLAALAAVQSRHLNAVAALSAAQVVAHGRVTAALVGASRTQGDSLASMMEGYLDTAAAAAGLEHCVSEMLHLAVSYCREVFLVFNMEQAVYWIAFIPKSLAGTASFLDALLSRPARVGHTPSVPAPAPADEGQVADAEDKERMSLCPVSFWGNGFSRLPAGMATAAARGNTS